MKRGVTITAATLAASVLLTLLFFVARKADVNEPRRRNGTPAVSDGLMADSFPFSMRPTERDRLPVAEQSRQETAEASTQAHVLRRPPPVPSAFTTVAPITAAAGPEMQSILAVVQDATLAIDGILKDRHYQIHTHGPSIWLTAEDRSRSTTWRVFPHGTNSVVGSVEAVVFADAAMLERDDVRSFEAQFDLDGTLRKFWWKDKHEIFRNHQDKSCVEYARRLEGQTWLNIRRDYTGNVLSSNVYDWSMRGRIIGGDRQPSHRTQQLGPSSAEEAATESWRTPRP
ncbi:MAG: hypothetical protein GX174_12540 [Lentisphaerae bacterium]|jgi:hypothetical protein|nr:hypothetical protein [Lentisphaerota bacterium]